MKAVEMRQRSAIGSKEALITEYSEGRVMYDAVNNQG
jgi:hypothetical protein